MRRPLAGGDKSDGRRFNATGNNRLRAVSVKLICEVGGLGGHVSHIIFIVNGAGAVPN